MALLPGRANIWLRLYDLAMDINLMVLNVGNSRLAIGVFVAGNLEHVTRVPLTEREQWQERIEEAWEKICDTESPAIAGASVNPNVLENLEHLVEQRTGQHVQWVGKELDLPIEVLTDNPEKTGVDRILATAAAYEQLGKACVVVDAGTAITVNCCNDAGAFVGGAIAPGASMMLDALHERTAKLPRVELSPPTGTLGTDTTSAIQHGVYHSIRGMVKEVVENYATELGAWPELIVTGGDAEALFAGWELVHAISPDLVLFGIALAYTDHHIKHQD